MKDKEKQEKVFDILNKFEFFQGQRAGRELWNDKPKEVQDQDIADFVKGINYIRSYLKDSVVLSREEYNDLILAKKTFASDGEEVSSDTLLSTFKGIKEQARKETAEKILNEVLQEIFYYFDVQSVKELNEKSLLASTMTFDVVTDKIFEIATREGVEIKE